MKILLFSILQLSLLNLFFLHAQQKDPVYLKTFGEIGRNQVYEHSSKTERATPPFPYSIDYSTSKQNELLYNGIILPNVWPPKTGNPFSNEPMDVPYLDNPPSVIPIDIGRQLFVDDFLIEQTNLQRVFHQATKYENNPIITQAAFRQGGVFYDFVNRQFVAVYRKEYANGNENPLTFAVSENLTDWHLELTGQKPVAHINAFWLQYDSLSRRNDWYIMGIDQIKPKPIDDPNVPFINALWENAIHKSTDGKSWSRGIPLGKSNDYSSFFYNPFRKIWVMSIKHNVPRIEKRLYRSRYYVERDTLEKSGNFNDAVFWVNADRLDQPHPEIGNEAQLYSLHGVAYESLILGAFQIHLGPSNEIAKKRKIPKYNEMKLGFSRDGFHWYRPDRNSFIKGTYRDGDWDRAFINIPQGVCLVMGDKLWFPYCGYSGIAPDGTHGMYEGGAIGMATLRRDGFASMETGKQPGTLLTRPVTFSGKFLFVNTDCPEGELLVEVLDENGIVMDQLTSEPIHTDKTLYKVVWESGADLSGLANKPVRFRFNLTNGKLYSFWVSPDESGASYGYVGAGGPGFNGIIDNKGINAY
ncbi:glycosyl hydrolase family 32 [Proteiniphilum sp.]|uniref:glycosyl hydrolase family 32 n=1 Tax=Proteiniphilum sp. TaxID=1926877 RepID=UPI002B1ECDE1|nr:glycosyl hydrolase family 32 [Proteiniphilum sp.]MEA4918651.1 glycosyl hydrolase family 32 [Proteiniphilum sp.]